MGKIKSSIILSELLDHDMSWRIREIADITTAIKASQQPYTKSLVRAGVPLLYAHWEGFVKYSVSIYLNFISNSGYKYYQLKPCFMAHGLRKRLNTLNNVKTISYRNGLIQVIESMRYEHGNLDYKDVIDLKSNLNSIILSDLLISIGIDRSGYSTRFKFIDSSLLGRRNSIAHGEYLSVNKDGFVEMKAEVMSLLRQFKSDLENSVATKSFLS